MGNARLLTSIHSIHLSLSIGGGCSHDFFSQWVKNVSQYIVVFLIEREEICFPAFPQMLNGSVAARKKPLSGKSLWYCLKHFLICHILYNDTCEWKKYFNSVAYAYESTSLNTSNSRRLCVKFDIFWSALMWIISSKNIFWAVLLWLWYLSIFPIVK